MDELEIALNDDSIKAEAGEILHSFIDCGVLTPATDAPDGIEAQLHRDLAGVLALSNGDGHKQKPPAMGVAGSLLSVVAGVGFTACVAAHLGVDAREDLVVWFFASLGPNRQVHSPTPHQ